MGVKYFYWLLGTGIIGTGICCAACGSGLRYDIIEFNTSLPVYPTTKIAILPLKSINLGGISGANTAHIRQANALMGISNIFAMRKSRKGTEKKLRVSFLRSRSKSLSQYINHPEYNSTHPKGSRLLNISYCSSCPPIIYIKKPAFLDRNVDVYSLVPVYP